MSVPNRATRGHLAQPELRQRRGREQGRRRSGSTDRLDLSNELTRIIVAEEFLQRRHNGHMDRVAVRGNVGDHVKDRSDLDGVGARRDLSPDHAISSRRRAAGADRAEAAAAGSQAGVQKGHISFDVHDLDLRLASTERRHFRGGEQINSLALLECFDRNAELRVGQDARDCSQCLPLVSQSTGEQLIGIGRSFEEIVARGIGRGIAGEEAAGTIGRRWCPLKRRRGPSLRANRAMIEQNISEPPVESEGSGVILRNFRKFGFDGQLRRRLVQHLDGLLDNVQVLQRRANIDNSIALIEENGLGRREIDSGREEKQPHYVREACRRIRRREKGDATLTDTASATDLTAALATKTTAKARDVDFGESCSNAALTAALAANAATTTTTATTAKPTPTTAAPAANATAATPSPAATLTGAEDVRSHSLQTLNKGIGVNVENAGIQWLKFLPFQRENDSIIFD